MSDTIQEADVDNIISSPSATRPPSNLDPVAGADPRKGYLPPPRDNDQFGAARQLGYVVSP